MKKRVVITGLGVISPVGIGKDEFWHSLINGISGIGPVTRFDASSFATRIAGEVKGFQPEEYLDKKEAKRMDRFTQFAVAAARMAVEDAGLNLAEIDKDRAGVVFGTGIGGTATFEEQHNVLVQRGPGRVSPFFVPMMIGNMAAGQIAINLGLAGPNYTIVNACASSTNSIGEALKLIQRGDADLVVTGGAEAAVTPMSFAGFCSMKAMSTRNDSPDKASRPFDLERDGFVLGEGAGVLILESLEHALKRGAAIYAELAGYGCTDDAYHITAPAPGGSGAAKAMEQALKDAGLRPEVISYINAHGTSTELNDKYETAAIKTVFGEHAARLAISSTKSMTGHLLGAAGAVEAVATTLAITNSIVPPTINYENPDPECDLDYVPNQAREIQINAALSNSFGFGGHNATIILKGIAMRHKILDEKRVSTLKQLVDLFQLEIEDLHTLNTALIHPTFVFENKSLHLEHNQRLEFLGDAVLGLVVGEYLYRNYPQKPEGELTKLRAAVVCETTLAKVAKKLGLGDKLLLGRGEELTGGRERPSILADAFEAVIAAIYLEAGLDEARRFIIEQLANEINEVVNSGFKDYKTMLQELVQKEHETNVTYTILEESGPDHDKSFVAGVIWKGNLLAKGKGKSKKEAEQQAAAKAIELLKGQA